MTEVKLIRIQTIQIPDWLRLYELLNLVFPQGGAGLGPDTASCSQSGFCFNFQINYQGDQLSSAQPSVMLCCIGPSWRWKLENGGFA